MQVKVCPKCGVDNNPNYPVCRRCQSSLAAVAVTESVQAEQQVTQSPYRPPVAPPVRPESPVGQPNPSPYGGIPPGRRTAPPIETPNPAGNSGLQALVSFLVLAVVCVGGYFTWRTLSAPKPPPKVPADQVVVAFLRAKSTGKIENVKQHLCKSSVEMLDKGLGRQAESAGITRQDAANMSLWDQEPKSVALVGAQLLASVIEDKEIGEGRAKVRATVKPTSTDFRSNGVDFQYMLINEDGQWKVDLAQSLLLNSDLTNLLNRR